MCDINLCLEWWKQKKQRNWSEDAITGYMFWTNVRASQPDCMPACQPTLLFELCIQYENEIEWKHKICDEQTSGSIISITASPATTTTKNFVVAFFYRVSFMLTFSTR